MLRVPSSLPTEHLGLPGSFGGERCPDICFEHGPQEAPFSSIRAGSPGRTLFVSGNPFRIKPFMQKAPWVRGHEPIDSLPSKHVYSKPIWESEGKGQSQPSFWLWLTSSMAIQEFGGRGK